MKRFTAILLTMIMTVSLVLLPNGKEVQAASKYIIVKDFIKELVVAMELPLAHDFPEPYIAAAVSARILKGSDFGNDFSGNITRTDAAVLLNRADEYLHGDTVDSDLVQTIINKRISDIKKIPESKRESVAKCYAKGIIKGYSNGAYSTSRAYKGKKYLTAGGAKAVVQLLIHPRKRAKLAPDGQLLRTTKLPKKAKEYPYILASYPNQYYDWKFSYEDQNRVDPMTNEPMPYIKYEEYACPAEIDQITYFDDFGMVKKEYLDTWVDKVKTYMECVFNVDYRTIDEEWVDKIISADYTNGEIIYEENTRKQIEKYIEKMKANKTIVESSKIAADGSSLYYSLGDFTFRVYVKYRIKSSKLKYGADADTLIMDNPYSKIFYTRWDLINLNPYTLGEWKEGYFDVELNCASRRDPKVLGVSELVLNEKLYEKRRVDQ